MGDEIYMKKLEIEISEETLEEINKFITYRNLKAILEPESIDKEDSWSVEDFITGCVNTYITEIKELIHLSNYGKLNKHHPIKNKFKEYIDELGMSQRDFCKMIGIHQSGLSNIINNQKQPSLDTFIKIWLGLGCPRISNILYVED